MITKIIIFDYCNCVNIVMAEVILMLHCCNSDFTIAVVVIQVTIKRSIIYCWRHSTSHQF